MEWLDETTMYVRGSYFQNRRHKRTSGCNRMLQSIYCSNCRSMGPPVMLMLETKLFRIFSTMRNQFSGVTLLNIGIVIMCFLDMVSPEVQHVHGVACLEVDDAFVKFLE